MKDVLLWNLLTIESMYSLLVRPCAKSAITLQNLPQIAQENCLNLKAFFSVLN